MAGGGRVKSFESSQGENRTYSIHVEGIREGSGGGTSKRFQIPGEGTPKRFQIPGEGTSTRFQIPGEGTLKRFHVPGGGKVKSREGI